MTREERLDAREHWLIEQICSLLDEYKERAKPFGEELAALRASRDRPIHQTPDGRYLQYTGPLPAYFLPGEEHE